MSSARIARIAVAGPRCRRSSRIPPHQWSSAARASPPPASRIDAAGRSGFKAPPQSPQMSRAAAALGSDSVFPPIGPIGNGPRDSSCVHSSERRNGREPGGVPGLSAPHITATEGPQCGILPTWEVVLVPSRAAYGVSSRAQPAAIRHPAQSALIFLNARATRPQPRGSAPAASARSPRRGSARSRAR
jgi:hypothetical protein